MAYLIGFVILLIVGDMIRSIVKNARERRGKRPWAP